MDVHLSSCFDLATTLIGDGVTDDSAAFLAAINQMALLGIRRVVSSNPNHRYKLVEVDLSFWQGKLEFDMNGATFVADWNNLYEGTHATMIKMAGYGKSVIFRNTGFDGGCDFYSTGRGHPMLLMDKIDAFEFDRVDFRNGCNRYNVAVPDIMAAPWRGCLVLVDVPLIYIHDSYIGRSMGEMIEIMGDTIEPTVRVERCSFDKIRSHSPTQIWSNSSIVVYNAKKGSHIADCVFGNHVASTLNIFGPFTVERCVFLGVTQSAAIDFNETGKFNVDAYVVRDCLIQNVVGGYAIRGSGRNVIIENVEINRCRDGIYIEAWNGTPSPEFDEVGTQRNRTMYNIVIRNIISNGNGIDGGQNTLIRIEGVSAAMPAYVSISGLGLPNSNVDLPSSGFNPEYGIYTSNCVLSLEGGMFQHGTTCLVRMTGFASFVARNCVFHGACSGAWLSFHSAQIDTIAFEDCRVVPGSSPATYHVQISGSSTIGGKAYFTRSAGLSARAMSTATVVNV